MVNDAKDSESDGRNLCACFVSIKGACHQQAKHAIKPEAQVIKGGVERERNRDVQQREQRVCQFGADCVVGNHVCQLWYCPDRHKFGNDKSDNRKQDNHCRKGSAKWIFYRYVPSDSEENAR